MITFKAKEYTIHEYLNTAKGTFVQAVGFMGLFNWLMLLYLNLNKNISSTNKNKSMKKSYSIEFWIVFKKCLFKPRCWRIFFKANAFYSSSYWILFGFPSKSLSYFLFFVPQGRVRGQNPQKQDQTSYRYDSILQWLQTENGLVVTYLLTLIPQI